MLFVQDRFQYEFYRNTSAMIIVYDCCDEKSFSNLLNWYTHSYRICYDEIPVVLVANKIDETTKRVVDVFKANLYAKWYGFFDYVEISAKTGQGVPELFEMIAKEVLHRDQLKNNLQAEKVSILLL